MITPSFALTLVPTKPVGLTYLSFSCGEAPRAGGQSGAPAGKRRDAVRLGGKRGFSPERGKRPATSCDEKLAGGAMKLDNRRAKVYSV